MYFPLAQIVLSAQALPCDVYEAHHTPCVAAHSTTRALFSSFHGHLYQVLRGDNATLDIHTKHRGGVADSVSQDHFCADDCTISVVYDQSPYQNHLTAAGGGLGGPGPAPGGVDFLANATAAPVYLNGAKAYGVYVEPYIGYRILHSKGVARGYESEGMYAVFDGTHYNDRCCFDYGNAEDTVEDTGDSHMETLNFSNMTGAVHGAGDGPWIMADLENGVFAGAGPRGGANPSSKSVPHRFVTSMLKGDGNTSDYWALRGGDATLGSLETFYAGRRPEGYFPPLLNGSVVLGVGGDNSNRGRGTFYEGAMTNGLPSDECEDAVQQSVVAAKYSP